MSAAELKELKNEMKKFIDGADERIVRKMYAVIEENEESEDISSPLTPEQEAILDEHIQQYENGLMKFSSWEDVKGRITSKLKNGL